MVKNVNITTHDWAEELLQELAEFTISIWKEDRPNLQLDRLVNWFKNLDLKYPPTAIIAKENEKIIGWVFFVQITATEAEINPWALNGHPIILKEYESYSTISEDLITKALEFGKSKGLTRVELSFRQYEEIKKVDYQALGTPMIDQNCHMRQELEQKATQIEYFKDYEVTPINKLDSNKFFQCFLETFRASKDLWLTDKSDEEMSDYFHEVILADDFPLIEPASIGILSNNQLIAFSIVRESHGENNGQLWVMGVHSSHRRKGIARKIMHYLKSTLTQEGYKSSSLNVNLKNTPAINLYLSEGYVKDWTQTSYMWKLEK